MIFLDKQQEIEDVFDRYVNASGTFNNFPVWHKIFRLIQAENDSKRVKEQINADVAQLVEQLICNQLVGGSIPSIGSSSGITREYKCSLKECYR